MRVIKDLRYADDSIPEHALDLYLPDDEPFQTLVWFHGGGLEKGDKALGPVASYCAARGVALASANYRMYESARYPDFILDAARAVDYVKRNIESYGASRAFYVGGSSAGAYLAMMLCFDARFLAPYGLSPDDMDGYIFNAGQPTTHYNVLRERGLDPRRVLVDEAAPLFHVGEREGASIPKMLFILAENDMENRREQTVLMRSTLARFGVPKEKMPLVTLSGYRHCGYNRAVDEQGESVLGRQLISFIGE